MTPASRIPSIRTLEGDPGQLLARLPVGGFTVVMATGVVSIAAGDVGEDIVADVLRSLGVGTLVVLLILHVARVLTHGRVSAADVAHPTTVFDAFSFVAAVAVTAVANRVELSDGASVIVWCFAMIAWLIVVAATLRALMRHRDFGLVHFASGRWLLSVVSVESIAVLGVTDSAATHTPALALVALVAWVLGIATYPAIALTIVMRIHRRGWHALDITPDHWILMGALAICTLAAALLATSAGVFTSAERSGLTATAWATWSIACALYVVLTAVTTRRWIISGTSRRSDLRWWASVFPLGMYTACTFELSGLTDVAVQHIVATVVFWPALGAWVLAAGMTVRVVVRTVQEAHA